MDTIALKPKRAELMGMLMGLAVMAAVMLFMPASCLPLSMVLPLLACPLVGHKQQEPLAWMSAAVPCVAALLAGYDGLLACTLLLPGGLMLGLTRYLLSQKRMNPADMLWYVCVAAVSLAAMLTALTRAVNAPLAQWLTEAIIRMVEGSEQQELLLLQLASAGFLRVPEGYTGSGMLSQLFGSAHIQQMVMSLRLTLETLIASMLPALCVHVCILAGLFTCIRVQHMNGVVLVVSVDPRKPAEKKAKVSAPPGFRMFYLPRALRWTALGVALLSMMLSLGTTSFEGTLGAMGYAVFEALFQLEGAAIVVFMLTVHDPDRAVLGGILAAALYVIAPTALMLVALLEPVFHFRAKQLDHSQEEEE